MSARAQRSTIDAEHLFGKGYRHQQQGNLDQAVALYKRVLALKPDHTLAHRNFGCVFLAQGKQIAASERLEQALMLLPQLYVDFPGIRAWLTSANPVILGGIKNAMKAWPRRLMATELFGSLGFDGIADDILLRRVLKSITIRDIGLERLLTCIRLVEATHDTGPVDNGTLHLCCALARRCFINEYVFAMTSEEAEEAELLKERLADALAKARRARGLMYTLGFSVEARRHLYLTYRRPWFVEYLNFSSRVNASRLRNSSKCSAQLIREYIHLNGAVSNGMLR
jgi:tetratricopeptide (TPR) repeat protein